MEFPDGQQGRVGIMKLELLKVIVQPVVLERNDDGSIVGERLGEATSLYTLEQVEEFVKQVRQSIEMQQQEMEAMNNASR
jgi:hypothetical protein